MNAEVNLKVGKAEQMFARGFVTDYPLTIRSRDGALTDVLYNASVYRDADGKVLGVFAAARNVTESKRVMRESHRFRRLRGGLTRQSLSHL